MKILASNKKAYFNFDILESFESGIVLNGSEVKSVKEGRISLAGSYIKIKNSEMFLLNTKIPQYKFSAIRLTEAEESRERKLLMHKKQIANLDTKLKQSGTTLVPLEVFTNDKSLIKVTVSLVKGRKKFDKRAKLKEKDMKRGVENDRKRYRI